MDASTEQKIRLLAIAILELDRDATERLLQHLPESLSQRILGQSQVLQDVSDQERAEAIETIASLLETAAETTDQVPRVSLPNPQDRTVPSWVESVQAEPLDALVSVLKFERPTVIATILRNLPSQIGQAIVGHLELQQAREALDWIPRLTDTPAEVLDAIGKEFRVQVAANAHRIQAQQQGQEKLLQLRSVLHDPQFASPPAVSNVSNAPASESTRPFVIPLHKVSDRDEVLGVFMKLDDLDLLRVLYSHTPQEVRQFLSGSSKSLRTRIEKLTPASGLKKLRRELADAPITDEKTWSALAEQFTKTAAELDCSDSSQDRYLASA